MNNSPRVYFDANILIEVIEGRTVEREQLVTMIRTVEQKPSSRFVTSDVSLAEVLVKPTELGRTDLLAIYEELLVPGATFDVLPVDRTVLRNAALYRSRDRSLKLIDAIHLATAARGGCTHVLTNDRRLRLAGELIFVSLADGDLPNLAKSLLASS